MASQPVWHRSIRATASIDWLSQHGPRSTERPPDSERRFGDFAFNRLTPTPASGIGARNPLPSRTTPIRSDKSLLNLILGFGPDLWPNLGGRLYSKPPDWAKSLGHTRENPYIARMIDPANECLHSDDSRTLPTSGGPAPPARTARLPVVVPIRSLGRNHLGRVTAHLLSLDSEDRYLRFGFAASDAHIQRYVGGLDMDRDEVFGIYNRKLELIAMAHLAYPAHTTGQRMAEFGVSVVSAARGRGYGTRLFDRACMHARNDGISHIFIHALSENTPMLKIARAAGAVVTRDGSESEAHLRLRQPTLDTRITEIVHEQLAQADYHMKERAHHLRTVLASLQSGRETTETPTSSEDT